MEFVQFHPTVLNKKINSQNFLISETVRGEGGILKNSKHVAFMKKYHKLKDLAPRDVVARAVTAELKRGFVYIDIRHKGKNFIKKRFPAIYKRCLKYGIDITKQLIPITPAAHFLCGGIKTDTYGQTNIKTLFALGETACTQVHGANRLASNSLIESLVFSSRAVKAAKKYLKNKFIIKKINNKSIKINKKENKEIREIKIRLQKIMWENVGIIRKEKELKAALEKLKIIEKQVKKIEIKGINEKIVELKNMVLVAKIITKSALTRKESRGTHYVEDYPCENKKWKKHIIIKK
jgi:L-aspartate oxidase